MPVRFIPVGDIQVLKVTSDIVVVVFDIAVLVKTILLEKAAHISNMSHVVLRGGEGWRRIKSITSHATRQDFHAGYSMQQAILCSRLFCAYRYCAAVDKH
jgi:hypothetical protein